jgi:hypothetical protein
MYAVDASTHHGGVKSVVMFHKKKM